MNLGVIFLIELGALAAVSYWGYTRLGTQGRPAVVVAPGVLDWLWGLFGSPRARFKLRGRRPLRLRSAPVRDRRRRPVRGGSP
ncbi:DUF2568 domain-containing protein [Streptomyces sp. NPDC007905]|uniref:DUF2568 domain-containing protein n=1 Tax=Streptomyces sp. NPDC007905 TaxID=3364788 RepID=UPI0036F152CF